MPDPDSPRDDHADDLTLTRPALAASNTPSAADEPVLGGDLGDRFRIQSLLGRGGMGEVYAAEDLTLGRRVALKAIRRGSRLSPEARERFQREARMLSRLDHPGICRIHDLFDTGGRDVLVLELIDGRTLREAAGELDDRQRLNIARQVAAVLKAAHAEGIVHRDLKPENIMLTAEGLVKVLDFGLARDLAAGQKTEAPAAATAQPFDPDMTIGLSPALSDGNRVLGTPAYLSPEQARGDTVTPATDMYAFGLVLQRLYTGRRPYDDDGGLEGILDQARNARTRPVTGIDRHLAQFIDQLESRSAAARPTAVEAARQLRWIQRKPIRRARRWVAAAVLLLVLAAGGKYMLDLRHERQIADRNRAEAEGLVEFMLGDLRERLEPVGRLDVLDEVGDRALAYFAARAEDERTDDDHHRFARAMNQIGEVRLNQGDLDAARDAFHGARLAMTRLVEQDRQRGEWLLTLAASEFWLGNVAFFEGDLDRAEEAFLAYREQAERLVSLDPGNEDWQRELGYAHTNLAALHEARGEVATALASLDQSIRIKRALAAAAPDDQGRRADLINSLAWQGNVMLVDGDLQSAHARYEIAVAEAESLCTIDPNDMSHRELLSSLLYLRGNALDRLGDDGRARQHYEASLEIARELVIHDPSNATWSHGLATSHIAIGHHEVWQGRLESAATNLTVGAAMAEELVTSEPANVDYLRDLADAHRGLAAVAVQTGAVDTARNHATLGLDAARRAHELGGGRTVEVTLARCLLVAGEIDRLEGRLTAADAAEDEAHGVLLPAAETSRSSGVRETWMRILFRRGMIPDAARVAAELHARGYARTDFRRFRETHGLTSSVERPTRM